jgi:hypothetical protein
MSDVLLTPISYFVAVTGVAECIAQALEDNVADGTLGRPSRVLIAPGQEAPWDIGGGGIPRAYCSQLAIVFAHGPYTSTRFPVEQLEEPTGGCDIGTTAVQCVASLVRCEYHPSPTNQGKTPPTAAVQTNAALLQCVEEFFMRQAMYCCLAQMKEDGQIDDYRINASDRQVNGDAGEVAIRFSLQII